MCTPKALFLCNTGYFQSVRKEIHKVRHILDLSHVCTDIPLDVGKLLEL